MQKRYNGLKLWINIFPFTFFYRKKIKLLNTQNGNSSDRHFTMMFSIFQVQVSVSETKNEMVDSPFFLLDDGE
jgi:hypothetical protein